MKKFFILLFKIITGLTLVLILGITLVLGYFAWSESGKWRGYVFATAFSESESFGGNINEIAVYSTQKECIAGMKLYRTTHKDMYVEGARTPDSRVEANGCKCGRLCYDSSGFMIDMKCYESVSCNE